MAIVVFSVFINALMLTGPLFMLQVYDRVLGSGSEATLVALSILVICLFLAMGVLENARGRVTAIVGARFQERLDRRVFVAAMQRSAVAPNDPTAMAAQRDLEAIRTFLASSVFLALMDLPWTPFFIAAIFIFHPLLGWLAIGGGIFLISVTTLNQILSKQPQKEAGLASVQSERLSDQLKNEAESLQALGMSKAGYDRWQVARRVALQRGIAATELAGGFGSMTKTFRLFLQSAMLGLGAWLVLQHQLTAGAMSAGSILMGRALAPIEMAVGQWPTAQRANEAWHRLSELLSHASPIPPRTTLPRPRALLEVERLTVGPPGEQGAILRMVSFRVEPGQAIGVIGSSGSGKSTLARALTGIWRPLGGTIRLDGAALDQYEPDVLGRLMGYLPQRMMLFDGTIAENIARLDAQADATQIVAAAKKADAHDMIVKLPNGYDTRISAAVSRLSGGQMQRIGLARALYGDPVLLVLDEPNSNLDNEGSAAMNAAIRAMKADGKSILIMAHRPAAIQECDLLLVLEGGMLKGFGPRDQVLRELVKNHTEVLKTQASGGVA
ncbi:type I secretion system permease/ATPase [Tabrizicola sp.]|uniref:type I secretion system permease/ATPase n=1 Tax=Tabrizicola sp. TaxID=2005166 RepID=UPI001A435FA1|nr:type I secretion system permease/ATPase [Tabrizicola sp.]MBL9074808.1 type I secretion system permease/ATPase [Tabrizicola sp.]